jgi:ribonuclease HI
MKHGSIMHMFHPTSFKGHLLFADGSSLGNPGPGGWGAVLVMEKKYIAELGGATPYTTNNKMELTAVIEGLTALANREGDLLILTDSSYVENGATKWIYGWKKKGWVTTTKTPVENRELWEKLDALLEKRKTVGTISWQHVPGHSGVLGNERCDEIATGYAKNDEPGLYDGAIDDYTIDILNISINEAKEASRSSSKSHSRAKAYSYLSLVDGVAKRHTTWSECEARVKGKSGVKFKKSLSKEDEHTILASWGVGGIG